MESDLVDIPEVIDPRLVPQVVRADFSEINQKRSLFLVLYSSENILREIIEEITRFKTRLQSAGSTRGGVGGVGLPRSGRGNVTVNASSPDKPSAAETEKERKTKTKKKKAKEREGVADTGVLNVKDAVARATEFQRVAKEDKALFKSVRVLLGKEGTRFGLKSA